MKWKYYNDQWYDAQGNPGIPGGNPPRNPRNGKTTYDDGEGAPVEPPMGYRSLRSFSGYSVWIKDNSYHLIHGDSAMTEKLVDGAYNGHDEWHRSTKVRGAASNDYYIHDYSTNTIYLLDQSVGNIRRHEDGIPMIEILKEGEVKDGWHVFK